MRSSSFLERPRPVDDEEAEGSSLWDFARQTASLDHLSHGRLTLDISQGDFRDGFEAANITLKRRGRGFEEFARAMRAVWGPDPVSFTETSTISQNQESGQNPYRLAAFQCYWVPSLPHH
jgi:alkanesulfonate monooxygenase SsuD/methylene tetrahydromethanopterin reductase-like flavin-dependent oxidoreductase (luciferase family)